MDLVKAIKTAIKETVLESDVRAVIDSGGVVFPYPRKGAVSINGGRLKPANKAAIELAQEWVKSQKR